VVAVKAYHLKWQELPLDANIKKWSVHVLNLDRHKRHLDRATLNQFWEILDRLAADRGSLAFVGKCSQWEGAEVRGRIKITQVASCNS